MSTIDEVLAAAEVVDAVCVIDGETRIISVPTEYKELGVESDEKVTRVKFQCPKIVGDNIDLTEYNLYINYRNAGNKLNSYLVEDVTVTGDTINFSWLLSRHVTESPGTINYIVCAKKSDNTGIINEWNTKVATGTVGIGLEATEEIEEQNIDVIEQILRLIVELENKVDGGGSGGSSITIDETLTEQGKAADAKAVGDAIRSLSEEIANLPSGGAGLTNAQVKALDGMFKVAAYIKADVSAEYSAFKTAFGIEDSGGTEPEKTLTSISATYSGGDVAVGTAVTDLTGIVVTAHYSDGSNATVTGYTLSGIIAEGSNTIDVTYGGMTTTFTVTGVAESGGDTENVSNETKWTNGVAYKYTVVADEYVSNADGSFISYSGWCRTPYLKCDGASKLRAIAKVESSTLLTSGANTSYNAFYDENKSFIQSFSFQFASGYAVGDCIDIAAPANAVYFILSGPNSSIGTNNSSGKPIVDFIPYA